jgi:hypothetical protein
MKKLIFYSLLIVLVTVAGWFGCRKETEITPNKAISPELSQNIRTNCGTPLNTVFYAGKINIAGMVTVSNDQNNIYVTVKMSNGWVFNAGHLYLGNCAVLQQAPYTHNGNPAPGQFPYQTGTNLNLTTYTWTVPMANAEACNCVAVQGEVSNGSQSEGAWAAGFDFPGANWATYFNYCVQNCTASCDTAHMKTITQGGWGAPAHGNNPGTYLDKNFAGAFPNGLTAGCNYSIKLSTSNDVRNALPQTGPPASLTTNYINPATKITVLAGQIIALKLNIGFDNYDPDFSPGSAKLEDLYIINGPFTGMTVAKLLLEGENVLGGCPSIYSASQINAAISAVNENFDGGNKGFISCTAQGIQPQIHPEN